MLFRTKHKGKPIHPNPEMLKAKNRIPLQLCLDSRQVISTIKAKTTDHLPLH